MYLSLSHIFEKVYRLILFNTAWKVSKYGVFSGPYLSTKYLSLFSPNAGKYGPEKTPYLDTFHAVQSTQTPFQCCLDFSTLAYQYKGPIVKTNSCFHCLLEHQQLENQEILINR